MSLSILYPASAEASKPCSRAQFHREARAAFDGKHALSAAEKRAVRRSVRCLRGKSETLARWHYGRYRRWHIYRRQVAAVTPYYGGGRRWAIPWPIVACESGGSWSAYNPSGALGPYQLLGKGAPFPVSTRAHRLAHHRIAFYLFAGGAGRSHWVC